MSAMGGEQRRPRRTGVSLAKASAIGVGAVSASVVVGFLWVVVAAVAGSGVPVPSTGSDREWTAADTFVGVAWLAIPCAVAATGLAYLSMRRSRGVVLGSRVMSCVLWTALAPVASMPVMVTRAGFDTGPVGASTVLWVGSVVLWLTWIVTLGPAFVFAIARTVLVTDGATAPDRVGRGSVYGRDEADEDAEVARSMPSMPGAPGESGV